MLCAKTGQKKAQTKSHCSNPPPFLSSQCLAMTFSDFRRGIWVVRGEQPWLPWLVSRLAFHKQTPPWTRWATVQEFCELCGCLGLRLHSFGHSSNSEISVPLHRLLNRAANSWASRKQANAGKPFPQRPGSFSLSLSLSFCLCLCAQNPETTP